MKEEKKLDNKQNVEMDLEQTEENNNEFTKNNLDDEIFLQKIKFYFIEKHKKKS